RVRAVGRAPAVPHADVVPELPRSRPPAGRLVARAAGERRARGRRPSRRDGQPRGGVVYGRGRSVAFRPRRAPAAGGRRGPRGGAGLRRRGPGAPPRRGGGGGGWGADGGRT